MEKRELQFHPAAQNPNVKKGEERQFLIEVYRPDNSARKYYTFAAMYLNAYVLNHEDEPYERPVTGWFSAESGDDDEYRRYNKVWLDPNDKIVSWSEIPQRKSE
ncbi:MAG: hypothetical protein GY928_32540 [Colwellia sp.]|nr:hypothetical protein [Colwellia sp.]